MYQKIVVPLDGSELAECILQHVEGLAKESDREIILVSVTERVTGYRPIIAAHEKQTEMVASAEFHLVQPQPVPVLPEAVGKMQRQAQRYLDKIAKRLGKQGIKVRTEVLLGNPAHEIINYAEQNKADLIVIASHGRSGISRWAFGSVADKILRASSIPVLIARPPGCAQGT